MSAPAAISSKSREPCSAARDAIDGAKPFARSANLLFKKLARDLDVARDESAESELEVVQDTAMEGLQVGCTFRREFQLVLDLLGCEFHQILVDDIADMLKVDVEGDDLHRASAALRC